jgi:hypothetical protein
MRWPASLALRFAKEKPWKEVARFVASISLSISRSLMSALCQKQTSAASFDHFVGGGKHRLRNCNVQRFSGFEVDGELDFRGLLDR